MERFVGGDALENGTLKRITSLHRLVCGADRSESLAHAALAHILHGDFYQRTRLMWIGGPRRVRQVSPRPFDEFAHEMGVNNFVGPCSMSGTNEWGRSAMVDKITDEALEGGHGV